MSVHGGGWRAFASHDQEAERPAITRDLLRRVWRLGRPCRLWIAALSACLCREPDFSGVTDLKALTVSQGTRATARGAWSIPSGLASPAERSLWQAATVVRHRKLGLSVRDC
jgi:hypothetical protein